MNSVSTEKSGATVVEIDTADKPEDRSISTTVDWRIPALINKTFA
jgi:hypothetical protein